MGAAGRGIGALALCLLLGHCGRASETVLRGEPGGWLAQCLFDADCAVGECTCGICTASCAENGCSGGPPGSACIEPGHPAHDGFCAGRSLEPICLSPCSETSECTQVDRCVDGVCLPEAAAALVTAGDQPSEPLCGANPIVYRSLLVTTQEQLDLLAGCGIIEGDLTFVLFPDADTSALESLRSVTGKLEISGNSSRPPFLPLPEFPGLESAGHLLLAFLDIGATDRFPALRTLAQPHIESLGRLVVSDCTGISDLSMFRRLSGIDSLELYANPDLVRLNGLGDVQGLRSLGIGLNPRLTSLAGMSLPAELVTMQITSNEGLSHLEGLDALKRVDTLELSGLSSLESLEGLGSLEVVTQLSISDNASLPSLTGLTALREVVGELNIWDNASLLSLSGLTALRQVGLLAVERNAQLSALGEWPSVERINAFYLRDNAALRTLTGLGATAMSILEISGSSLTDLSGLERSEVDYRLLLSNNVQLKTLNGAPTPGPYAWIAISDSPSLTDLSALAGATSLQELSLTNVGIVNLDAIANVRQIGSLELRGNPNLIQVDGLSQLGNLVELVVSDNPVLQRLPSFPNVITVPSEFFPGNGSLHVELDSNTSLTEGPSFPALDRALEINVQNNPNLARLAGFARLETVMTLQLVNNTSLAEIDFSNLRAASSVSVDQNPALSEDQVAPLLQLTAGTASAENP